MKRKGFKSAEKKRMMLSQETLSGIHMTSKCQLSMRATHTNVYNVRVGGVCVCGCAYVCVCV